MRAPSALRRAMLPPPFTRSVQSLPRYLLQSTVYLLPIMPSEARACGRALVETLAIRLDHRRPLRRR